MTTAAERLLVPGPEERQLAERAMIGLYLQEIMRPGDGNGPDFRRIDYQHYDRVEGRWKYVSMDTRLPVSIMPASSFGGADNDTLRLESAPLGFIGFGDEVAGTLTRSDMVTTRRSDSHELKQQHFASADGTGRQWLAVQYEYRR